MGFGGMGVAGGVGDVGGHAGALGRVYGSQPGFGGLFAVIDNWHRRRGGCECGFGTRPSCTPEQDWSEVWVDIVDGANTQTNSQTSMRAHIDRIRVSAVSSVNCLH